MDRADIVDRLRLTCIFEHTQQAEPVRFAIDCAANAASGRGIASMCPFRNWTFSLPAAAVFCLASVGISLVMSTP